MAIPLMDERFPPLARAFHDTCYASIQSRLNLDFSKDAVSRDVAEQFLTSRIIIEEKKKPLAFLVRDTTAIIIAPGPTVNDRLDDLEQENIDLSRFLVVGVDGATKAIIDRGINIKMVVSDLDGLSPREIVEITTSQDAAAFVHCHGNNVDKIRTLVSILDDPGRFEFTTQVEPTAHVSNLGGFTDGDRALFTVIHRTWCESIALLSMDLDSPYIGPASKPSLLDAKPAARELKYRPVKKEKLKIAVGIIRWLLDRLPAGKQVFTYKKHPPFDFIENKEFIPRIT